MNVFTEHVITAPLGDRLRDACGVSAGFLSDIVSQTCRRFPATAANARTVRVERLIRSQAWTDTALALIDLELPEWQVRRLAYDAGEWHCALSRRRELPEWLDQPIETRHADLALAILAAFVEAWGISQSADETKGPAGTRDASPLDEPVCADNFA